MNTPTPARRDPAAGPRANVAEGTISVSVGLENMPELIRSRRTLDDPDYADLFTMITGRAGDKSPEQWARTFFEDVPFARHYVFIPWRLILRLRLGPSHSPSYVHGWRIAARGDDWIRIETASRSMTVQAVFLIGQSQLSGAFFIRYDRTISRIVWGLLSYGHRLAGRIILRQALRAAELREAA